MKKYIGTKHVEAEPMTMGEAYERGLLQVGRVPDVESAKRMGYHVRYADGYGSWSPAKPFEEAYKVADTFLDRLHIEMRHLYEKMDKLSPFIESGKIDEVVTDKYQNYLLRLQHKVMSRYINILECRIGRLDGSPEAPLHQMTFGDAIEILKNGGVVRRINWTPQWRLAYVPLRKDSTIRYVELIDTDNGTSEFWHPCIEDMFAEDWEISMTPFEIILGLNLRK